MGQESGGRAVFDFVESGEAALIEEFAAGFSAFGTDFNYVVGLGDAVEMVLDEDDGVPLIDEAVEQVVEAFNIAAMEADGGFFEEVEVACAEVVLPLFE